jgi:hypothetical protein
MALQLGALRAAHLDAGASADKADKAAEELAGYESRPGSIDSRLSLLTWMVGTNLAVTVTILWRVFQR